MILVDTNVVSETMRAKPAPQVVDWLNAQSIGTLHLAAISLAELLYGIAALPEGRRKAMLGTDLAEQAASLFGDRVLPFDVAAAKSYATVVSGARRNGRVISVADGQIAAIAADRGFAVATRDTAPFKAAGVDVIDPWMTSRLA